MRRLLLLAIASLLCSAVAARAGGVNLSWDRCWSDGGVVNKSFACGTNAGADLVFGSFMLAEPFAALKGIEATVDIRSNSSSLPNWWQFYNPGSCRQTALTATFDFRGYPSPHCVDPWLGQASGGITAYLTISTVPPVPGGAANSARLILSGTLPGAVSAAAGVEHYGFLLSLGHAKTTGGGSCSGCTVPVSLVLSEIRADNEVAPGLYFSEYLSAPLQNVCLTWQGASGVCGPTPVRNSAWGAIKSLYR